jgi:hypothetical protein
MAEVLFGLIMVLTLTGSLRVATENGLLTILRVSRFCSV